MMKLDHIKLNNVNYARELHECIEREKLINEEKQSKQVMLR